MIVVLSPAKSLDLSPSTHEEHTFPALQTEANRLAKVLKKLKKPDLQKLMNISEPLAKENVSRYKIYRSKGDNIQSKRAINTFMGDVYRGLDVSDFDDDDYQFAQRHLRILSGLYGVLRPLDMIQAHRLEMGTRLATDRGSNLYQFWGKMITREINKALKESDSSILVNLASDEYFKSIKKDHLKANILNIGFKEFRNDALTFISFSAKVARGMMGRYIIKNKLQNIEDIQGFSEDGYAFSPDHSSIGNWVFVR